jgi:hypothetical protein
MRVGLAALPRPAVHFAIWAATRRESGPETAQIEVWMVMHRSRSI